VEPRVERAAFRILRGLAVSTASREISRADPKRIPGFQEFPSLLRAKKRRNGREASSPAIERRIFGRSRERELAIAITDYTCLSLALNVLSRCSEKQQGCLPSGRLELYTRRLLFPLGDGYVAVEGSSPVSAR